MTYHQLDLSKNVKCARCGGEMKKVKCIGVECPILFMKCYSCGKEFQKHEH